MVVSAPSRLGASAPNDPCLPPPGRAPLSAAENYAGVAGEPFVQSPNQENPNQRVKISIAPLSGAIGRGSPFWCCQRADSRFVLPSLIGFDRLASFFVAPA